MRKRIGQDAEDIKAVIERRNKRLTDFFKTCGLSVRIIGDENHPAIVYKEKYVLNAYVHNFELRFTDSPIQGNVIYTVKLSNVLNFSVDKVMACINDYEKRELYRIILNKSNPAIYLSGYGYLNKEEKLGKYPVFAAECPKVYFTEEKANEICEDLNGLGYSVSVT